MSSPLQHLLDAARTEGTLDVVRLARRYRPVVETRLPMTHDQVTALGMTRAYAEMAGLMGVAAEDGEYDDGDA